MIAYFHINVYICAWVKIGTKTRTLWTPWLDLNAASFRRFFIHCACLMIAATYAYYFSGVEGRL